jgi:hypothetical protein
MLVNFPLQHVVSCYYGYDNSRTDSDIATVIAPTTVKQEHIHSSFLEDLDGSFFTCC